MTEDELDEPSESESLAEVPVVERRLVTQAYDLSVSTLVEQWADGTLVLPDIQRDYVWNNTKASRLVESLLLNVPIPVLYLAESPGDTYEIIDGHQRIRSIARFLNNEFKLVGLQVLGEVSHRGQRFHQLPSGDQRRIRTRVIRAIILTEESHPTMKFEVFERLNAGSMALNAQEIRNSTYQGPFMSRVRNEWVHNEHFRAAIGRKHPRGRMADEELIIRALAMRERLESYRPPLPRFLNNFSKDMNLAGPKALDDLGAAFKRAARNVYELYGPNSFRLTDARGELIEKQINRGLAEAQLVTLADADPEKVSARSDRLRAEFGALHVRPLFLDFIQRAIVDRTRAIGRMSAYSGAAERAGIV